MSGGLTEREGRGLTSERMFDTLAAPETGNTKENGR